MCSLCMHKKPEVSPTPLFSLCQPIFVFGAIWLHKTICFTGKFSDLFTLTVKRRVDFSLIDNNKIVSIMSHRSHCLSNATHDLGVLIVFNGLKVNAAISVGFRKESE